ncbi:MAG: redox-regulated ATPase YchF [Dehalococcoidia bacterium]|nr:redox-regulated ATPase YchF [Dehalococcoidia bacterium]
MIGLAQSGKTCLFNALTGVGLPTGPGAAAREPHPGIVKVPDPRLQELDRLFHSKKIVPAEVEFLDFPGSLKGYTREKGSGAGYLTDLAQMDALVYVVRVFSQANVAHEAGSVDPWRDLETLEFELSFADMVLMDKRLERIRDSAGKAKAQDRDAMEKDRVLLSRLKDSLEKGTPLRAQVINEEEEKLLRAYQFLTSRPVMVVLNIGEEDMARASELEIEARRRLGPQAAVLAVSCQIEMEISELDRGEADEFRAGLGIEDRPVQRLVDLCHSVTDRIHFLTTGEDETRAWPLPRGATALQAAGTIHSDLERGYIRAEVIPWQELVKCGSLPEAKKRGLVRSEGKVYIVQDGDVMNILFHV